mmetsp:Transcript_30617/g.73810  ORF Transcript_30617/g.73810 Transcript_30617/m.73810 type:complete len:161 (-) Transcript_30617:86-568(-)
MRLGVSTQVFKEKVNKHHDAYRAKRIHFVPIVTSTYGRLHEEAVRFGAVLSVNVAKREAAFCNTGHRFEDVVARKVEWVFASLGASIARGMAIRACGLTHAREAFTRRTKGWRTQEDIMAGTWGDQDSYDSDDAENQGWAGSLGALGGAGGTGRAISPAA